MERPLTETGDVPWYSHPPTLETVGSVGGGQPDEMFVVAVLVVGVLVSRATREHVCSVRMTHHPSTRVPQEPWWDDAIAPIRTGWPPGNKSLPK